MSAAVVVFEAWTVASGAIFAGCLLRLSPITVALVTPAAAGMLLVAQAVA